ncbi:hypothetical protein IFR04_013019 [Cadophora malorum]|uniref:Uncharacterized protein n=1 Tax=Cadophora malorum TaxID=108018 RepID=A0A8H7T6F9_9HELO|nr:hypothetical protein IFR04_013019 [Cadophora malorum]
MASTDLTRSAGAGALATSNIAVTFPKFAKIRASAHGTYAGAEIDDDRQDFTKRLQNVMLECPASQGVAGTLSKLEALKTVTLQADTFDDSRQGAMNMIQFEIAYCTRPRSVTRKRGNS